MQSKGCKNEYASSPDNNYYEAKGLINWLLSIMKYTVISIAALASQIAFAVCIDGHPSVEQELNTSTLVIEGVVKSVAAVPESKEYFDGQRYSVDAIQTFKGAAKSSVEIFSENSSGRFSMEIGATYLLFLHKEAGLWQVNNCGNSAPASDAGALVTTLKSPRQ